ncbi:TetR/AcrR family transcriptional regulator [Gluconobacter kondonii]|uniref:TetR/AcrR family transcriptional regulator n=1 Tax=Gluconobacter kondonii TaxID=941463 RepID=UPI00197D3D3C|nr:TetR/AcrR family transcriptional regulator [Gluconobacter kondonii]MBN3868033.1 TetR/AcrR family transcriptional regulator [Gluconobacter kondonii]
MTVSTKQMLARRAIVDAARPLIGSQGFSAVGISQIIEVAGIPKGSFYHYFESKEAFGEELLHLYISDYLAKMDVMFGASRKNGREKILAYCQFWWETHVDGKTGDKCLIVKLGAEVSDLSERMRHILKKGTEQAVERITAIIRAGQEDGSIQSAMNSYILAQALYQQWLGATLMVKITKDSHPFDNAWVATKSFLDHT